MSQKDGRGNRQGVYVLCPLFVSFGENEIKCRSHVPDASSVVIKYANVKLCKTQRNVFCEGCYKRCEHYRAWDHFMQWEEEDE